MIKYVRWYIPVFLFLFFSGFISCKKDLLQWHVVQQLDSHTTQRLNKIVSVGDSIYIIGGGEKFGSAIVLRSRDKGYTWAIDSFPQVGKAIYGAGVSPAGAVYMCGIDGKALISRNTGITWQPAFISDGKYYVSAAFPTNQNGILVSQVTSKAGTIIMTDTDLNIKQSISYSFALNNVKMATPGLGYVVGYGAVLQTTDSGSTWNYLNVAGDNFNAVDIHQNGNEVWICGYEGSVFYTKNSGANWTRLRDGNDITIIKYRLLDIAFKDDVHGWAVGEDGLVIYTDDGGQHWMKYDNFTNNALRSIIIKPDGSLIVAGDNGALYNLQ